MESFEPKPEQPNFFGSNEKDQFEEIVKGFTFHRGDLPKEPVDRNISPVYAETVGIPEEEPKITSEADFAERWGYVPTELELSVAKKDLKPGEFSEEQAGELLTRFNQARLKRSLMMISPNAVTVLSDGRPDVPDVFNSILNASGNEAQISQLGTEQKHLLLELTGQRMKFAAGVLYKDYEEKTHPGNRNERILKGERKRWKGFSQASKPWWVRNPGVIRDLKKVNGIVR